MRRRINIKAHAIAISAITLTVLILYSLMKPAPPATIIEQIGDNYIRIEQAHWGVNCNEMYKRYQQERRLRAPKKDTPIPSPVPSNNILSAISKQCNLQRTCSVLASTETLGDPYKGCLKEITISWRCFSYDKLHSTEGAEGDTITINCDPKDPATDTGNP